MNTAARYQVADDYPIGASSDAVDALVEIFASGWGTSDIIRLANSSRADDAEYVCMLSRMFRSAAAPRSVAAQFSYIFRSVDVRGVSR